MPLDNSPRFQMLELGTTVSTNTFLRDYRPPSLPEMTLVTADYQTAGRGQTGNSWESEPGKNLLFSFLLQPAFLPAARVFALSEAIALALRETVEALLRAPQAFLAPASIPSSSSSASLPPSSSPVTVKWPNDIYVGDSKIAGILIENEFSGSRLSRAIIGCGLNVNQRAFAFSPLTDGAAVIRQHTEHRQWEGTPAPPTSLALLTGLTFERSLVLDAIVAAFRRRYAALQSGRFEAIHSEYHSHLYRRSGLHPFADASGSFLASISHVDPDGHIVLLDENSRLHRYAFKEVSFLRE